MSDKPSKMYRAYCIQCEWITEPTSKEQAHAIAKLHKDNSDCSCSPEIEAYTKPEDREKCKKCGYPLPTPSEERAAPEGWGEWLCWGDLFVCNLRQRHQPVKLCLDVCVSYDHAKMIEDYLRWIAEGPMMDDEAKNAFLAVADEIGKKKS